ncbi:hypothetical protein [Streptomyces sp. A5-4]|uniref:hypothetical protein n=1 Tax=Streptomyces sp. A5-4 TaxID=3384771 RepID=UPI003DA893A3
MVQAAPAAPRVSGGVIDALDRQLTDGDPLILTSQSAAYHDVTDSHGKISAAAATEALPVESPDAVAYLRGETLPEHVRRWDPVFEELGESPLEPVALALSNPLMLWLARRVYELPSSTPAALVDAARFPTRASIEDHLLDRIAPVSRYPASVFARPAGL